MFDQQHIIAHANLITAVCYFVIPAPVATILWVERSRGFNALGATVFGIFIA